MRDFQTSDVHSWLAIKRLDQGALLIVKLKTSLPTLPTFLAPNGETTKFGRTIMEQYQGILISADSSTIELEIDEPKTGRISIPRESIETVDSLVRDPDDDLKDGLLYGLGAGAAALGIAGGLVGGFQDTNMGFALMVFFAPPVAIGVLADAANEGKTKNRIYEAPE